MRKLVVACLILAACGGGHAPPKEDEAPIPDPPVDAISKEADQGAAKVTVKVWPARPNLGDSIWLRVDVDAPDGVNVDLPFDQDALGRFQVLRYAPTPGKSEVYELSAPASGKQRIPPLRLVVHDTRGSGAPDAEVLTDEIPIDVGTVLANRTDRDLSPPQGPIDTEMGRKSLWPIFAAIGGALVLIAGGVALWLFLRKRAVRLARISAWELAMQQLAELEARGAPAADAADAWFVALSSVIRGYVEGRYRARAPELTTEEFLAEAQRIPELDEPHRDLLASFLERCDRVKFAGWRPDADQSLEVLASARSFVVDSKPREEATPRAPLPQAAVEGAP